MNIPRDVDKYMHRYRIRPQRRTIINLMDFRLYTGCSAKILNVVISIGLFIKFIRYIERLCNKFFLSSIYNLGEKKTLKKLLEFRRNHLITPLNSFKLFRVLII